MSHLHNVPITDQYDNILYDSTRVGLPPPLNNNMCEPSAAPLTVINNLNKDKLNKNMEADMGAAASCAGATAAAGDNVNMNIKGELMQTMRKKTGWKSSTVT